MVYPSLWSRFSPSRGGIVMRCLSCNCNLSDREANRKYDNHAEIVNPESRYIGLCDDCILDTDLAFEENPNLSNDKFDAEESSEIEVDEPTIWDDR